MLTNEKRAMIQRRLNDSVPYITPGEWYHEDIPMLLREIDIALKTCPNSGNDGYITPRPCQSQEYEMKNLESDRDHWKTKAEALERALRHFNPIMCMSCSHWDGNRRDNCGNCNGNHFFINWQFDQARFIDKLTQRQDERKCDRCGISFLPINQLCICDKCDAELEIQCQDKNKTNSLEINTNLDNQRICDLFAIFADLPDEELPRWKSLCEKISEQIVNSLKKDIDMSLHMEQLCVVAAAIVYCNYIKQTSGKESNNILDAIAMRDYFLKDSSDLVLSKDLGELFVL